MKMQTFMIRYGLKDKILIKDQETKKMVFNKIHGKTLNTKIVKGSNTETVKSIFEKENKKIHVVSVELLVSKNV